MAAMSITDCKHGTVVRLDDAIKTDPNPMSNTQQTVQDIHDILCSYYEVALKRFTDNVAAQAVIYDLLSGPETPLGVFSPAFVGGLTAEELQGIAGEAPSVRRKREQLVKEIESLTEAKTIVSRVTV